MACLIKPMNIASSTTYVCAIAGLEEDDRASLNDVELQANREALNKKLPDRIT
jgi:hypothetical protein